MDKLELLVFKEFIEGKIQADKLELDKRGFYKIGRFQMKQLQIIGKKILNELDKDNNIISDLQNEVTLKQCELDNKDKIIIAMAEQLTTPVHGIDWVIDYFTKKCEGK